MSVEGMVGIMKMRPEHYAQLEQAVKSAMAKQPEITAQVYLDQGMTNMRFRWDAMRAGGWNPCTVYDYCNDNHIDTALRRITGTK
jgi:hypothetical protein